MTEQWTRWEPIQGLSANYYVDSISDGMAEFKIVLSDANNRKKEIHIIFKDSVSAYRSTYESFRQHTLDTLGKQYDDTFYLEWALFKVVNSTYSSWLSEQSYGITDLLNLMHFSIYGIDFVVDIIAAYEPVVQLVESE